MDEYRRLLAIQSFYKDLAREVQADRRSHQLLGRTRHNYAVISRLGLLVTLVGIGLFLVWGH